MGWDNYQAWFYKKNGEIDRKAECDAHFERYCRVEKSVMRGSVYYAAVTPVREYKKISDNPEVWDYVPIPMAEWETFCVVCVTRTNIRERENFWMKVMSEDMGPFYYDCPESILRLLSPTDNQYALEWRRQCRENRKRLTPGKLPIGTRIKFKIGEREYTAEKRGPAYQFKKSWWDTLDGKYMPRNRIPDNFEVIPV